MTDIDISFAVSGPVKYRSPFFQLAHAVRCLLGVNFSHFPVIAKITANESIGKMLPPRIARINRCQSSGNATFRHHRVSFTQKGFTNQCGFTTGGGSLNRGS